MTFLCFWGYYLKIQEEMAEFKDKIEEEGILEEPN
jgi:hypothetical protein